MWLLQCSRPCADVIFATQLVASIARRTRVRTMQYAVSCVESDGRIRRVGPGRVVVDDDKEPP
jgi:hypothetical protein